MLLAATTLQTQSMHTLDVDDAQVRLEQLIQSMLPFEKYDAYQNYKNLFEHVPLVCLQTGHLPPMPAF